MSDYRVATGHGVALGSLTVLSPQPKSRGVQATRRVPSGDGSVTDQGLFVLLDWRTIVTSSTEYDALLTEFGLDAAKSADVTIYARNDLWVYTRYNGLAIRPAIGEDADWSNYFGRFSVLIRNLEAL